MNPFQLAFKVEDAYKYQLALVQHLIRAHSEVLHKLKTMSNERRDMRALVGESPEVWDAMVQIIKPTSQITDAQKKISLQEKIVEFLKLKSQALEFMISGNKVPQVNVKILIVKTHIEFRSGQTYILKKCELPMKSWPCSQ